MDSLLPPPPLVISVMKVAKSSAPVIRFYADLVRFAPNWDIWFRTWQSSSCAVEHTYCCFLRMTRPPSR